MTQEEKELLLKDLCARLPYGVVVHADDVDIKLDRNHRGLSVLYYEHYSEKAKKNCGYNEEDFSIIISGCFYGHNIKPYLFPLSSMTEEQENEFHFLFPSIVANRDEYGFVNIISKSTKDKYEDTYNYRTRLNDWKEAIQWLLKNHFDINGLIPKNLAIDVTNLNIYG